MANWQVISLDTTTPQLRAPGTGDGYSFNSGSTQLGVWTTTALDIGTALTVDGNATLGNASTDTVTVNGYMGVGGNPAANIGVYSRPSALTGTTQSAMQAEPTGTSGATSGVRGFSSFPKTEAAAFTSTNVVGYYAGDVTKGAGSAIVNQHGAYIADQTQGTNNFGITSLVSSGSNKWNIYASGTANNYFAGNLGIGTTSPGAKLESAGTSNGATIELLRLNNAGTGGNTATQITFRAAGTNYADITGGYGASSPRFSFNVAATGYQSWAVGGTDRMTLDASGNLGVNTTSPTSRVHAVGTIQSTTGSSGVQIYGDGGAGFVSSIGANPLIFLVNATERARITATGDVGIGTTSPGARLDVVSSTYPNFIANRSVSTGGSGSAAYTAGQFKVTTTEQMSAGFGVQQEFVLRDADATDNAVASILVLRDGADNSGAFTVRTAAAGSLTEKMRIDSSGNVVVNTAAVATTATDGFLYIPGCAGTPTGTPTAYTGRVPLVVDTTNNKLYFYSSGAWRDAGP